MKKKKGGFIKVVIVILVVLIVLGGLGAGAYFVGLPMLAYKKASDLEAQGEYTAAAEAFKELGDYRDSADRANGAIYAYAESLMDEGEYEKAIKQFRKVRSYSDAKERIEEATELMENGGEAEDWENPSATPPGSGDEEDDDDGGGAGSGGSWDAPSTAAAPAVTAAPAPPEAATTAAPAATTAAPAGTMAAPAETTAAQPTTQAFEDDYTPYPAARYTYGGFDWWVSASSVLDPGAYYGATSLVDWNYKTAWTEGEYGDGVGEWIRFDTADGGEVTVTGIAIVAGYRETEKQYYESNRPTEVTLGFSDGSTQNVRLTAGYYEADVYELPAPIDTTFVRIQIRAVESGTVYNDTCISEIHINPTRADIGYMLPLRSSQPVGGDSGNGGGSTGASSASDVSGYRPPAANGGYVLPESDRRYYAAAELYVLSAMELELARNEIYARHGRLFQREDLQAYFDSMDWYDGYISAGSFSESVFNTYEKENLKRIEAEEASRKASEN